MPNDLRLVSTSRDPPEYIAPVCDCLWHPRRLPGFPMPNEFTLVSTSWDPPEYIATVCDCLWHHHSLQGCKRVYASFDFYGISRGHCIGLLLSLAPSQTSRIPGAKRPVLLVIALYSEVAVPILFYPCLDETLAI